MAIAACCCACPIMGSAQPTMRTKTICRIAVTPEEVPYSATFYWTHLPASTFPPIRGHPAYWPFCGPRAFSRPLGICYKLWTVNDTGKQGIAPAAARGVGIAESGQSSPVVGEGSPPRQEDASRYCPVCSQRLESRRCKLICNVCGYYMSCADYY